MRKASTILGLSTLVLWVCVGLGFSVAYGSTLDSIAPAEPHRYLEVGEQRAELAGTPDELKLAREILAMGIVVQNRASNHAQAASCAIALANTYSSGSRAHSDLWDLALLHDPSCQLQWATHRKSTSNVLANQNASDAIAFTRYGEGKEVSKVFDQQQVRSALRDATELLGIDHSMISGEIRDVANGSSSAPCRGEYFVNKVEDGRSVSIICPSLTTPLGTMGGLRLLQPMLATEFLCLGRQYAVTDWTGAHALKLTQPMRTPSLDWVVEEFEIDPNRPYFRNGSWRSSP